ncbi:MAG: OadG family protein [Synergistaceae bacterium]|nr:OadG family protein [Synergistaceae bacterium]
MHFEGIAGAINVSVVAFSIVFGVLLVLTGVIYGMKLFAGGDEKKNDVVLPGPAKPSASSSPKPSPAKTSGDKAKIVAAITAAIVEFTGSSDFRILSVSPETQEMYIQGMSGGDFWTRRWKAAGMLSLNANRLNRKWH